MDLSPTPSAPHPELSPLPAAGNATAAGRFGTFGGVFTPSILTILGVIMYLRMGWVVGNVGLGGALLIVLIAHVVSVATGLSVASIATNRLVRAGGAYHMISRSLGASVGAAIGVPLFFGQALSTTFYIVGFCEALNLVAPGLDTRVVGSGILLLLTLVALKSAETAIRLQYVILAAIILSLISFFAGGSVEGATEIVWFRKDGESFSYVFAVFFPAVTGIMAGVSMSGDLKDARRSLPRGTIASILVGLVIYLAMPIWMACNASMADLAGNNYVMWSIALFPAAVYLGVWGATLSSAVGSILGGPRTLQALARDGLVPAFLGKGHGAANEPRTATVFTFLVAEAGILAGDLELIAPILTMFFLATYGVTNLACGLERWAASPSFRPGFRVPAWVSLGGAAACFYVMSIVSLPAMVAALLVCAGLFVYARRRSYGDSWGDARHGIWAALLRTALLRLRNVAYHPRNWRPNLVIFGGDPNKRSYMLDIGCALVEERGVVSYFYLLEGDILELAEPRKQLIADIESRFKDAYPNLLLRVDIVDSVYQGVVSVAQSYGLGTFETNTVMLGWLSKGERTEPYLAMLRKLVAIDCSLLLVRQKPVRGLGSRKRIDIWWGGLKGNGGLMLLIAFLLKCNDAWSGARVRVITVVQSEDEAEQAETNLRTMLDEARMDAHPHVVRGEGRPIAEIMKETSRDTDLAILGLRMPDEEPADEEFIPRMESFLAALPTTIMAYSARNFEGEPVLFDD